jgi:hypothetical protein
MRRGSTFVFNGTIEGEGRNTGPGTDLADGDPNGDVHDDDDQGDDGGGAPEDTTLMLADDLNKKICFLGVSGNVDGDDGGDGYSPLGVFGLDGDDDGSSGGGDGDEHHHGRHSRKTGAQTNRQTGRLGQGLTGAERH